MRIAVIGAGMSGILSAIKLREAGFTDFTVYEKADRLGGTWRENTYPGIACDVPSHLYSYSFAPNVEWSHTYSPGPEIQAYFEGIAEEYEVVSAIRFGDEVVRADFVGGRWHLETASGHRDEVDAVIAATGVLHHPRLPDIDGIDEFEGSIFHSSRWDHDARLDGARVGVVGTGSTAIQITTALVDRVAHYSLFQRTAQWVMPMPNTPYSDEQREVWRADPDQLRETHAILSERFGGFARAVIDADSPEMAWVEQMCRENLERVVDPELKARLQPDYRAACKRLVVSPNFYESIQHPDAELVTEAIERIDPKGIRTKDGRLHELDVIVLATGFRADAFMRPMEITGRGGVTLADEWAERPNAYLAITIPEFPNLFMLNGPNGPVGNFSLIEVAELQFGYVVQLLERLRDNGHREISPRREAMDEYEAARVEASKKTIWVTGCRSWYLDDRGVPATWPWTFDHFRERMAAPDFEAFDLR